MDEYTSKQTVKVFKTTGVLTEVELQSRKEVFWEIYCKKLAIEAKTLCDLVTNHVIPVAIRYQNILLENVKNLKEIYKTPELARSSWFTYNAMAHPQFERDGEILVSFNVNTPDFSEQFSNVESYRPRFFWYPVESILP